MTMSESLELVTMLGYMAKGVNIANEIMVVNQLSYNGELPWVIWVGLV